MGLDLGIFYAIHVMTYICRNTLQYTKFENKQWHTYHLVQYNIFQLKLNCSLSKKN